MSSLRDQVLDCAAALDGAMSNMGNESTEVQEAIRTRKEEKQRVFEGDDGKIWTNSGCPKNPSWFKEWAEENHRVMTEILQGAKDPEVRHQVTEAQKSMYKAVLGSS